MLYRGDRFAHGFVPDTVIDLSGDANFIRNDDVDVAICEREDARCSAKHLPAGVDELRGITRDPVFDYILES